MVFGILVEGYHITTYAMDLKAEVYRMVQLGSCNLMSHESDLGAFPALFLCLLQAKTLAANVANKIKRKRRNSATRFPQPRFANMIGGEHLTAHISPLQLDLLGDQEKANI